MNKQSIRRKNLGEYSAESPNVLNLPFDETPKVVPLSAQAKALFKEWYDKLADQKSIYEALPLNFETGDGIRIADSYGMGERTFKRWLNSSLFKKIDHGYYEKKYR